MGVILRIYKKIKRIKRVKVIWQNWLVLTSPNMQTRFNRIYKYRYWGSAESVSGAGSTYAATETIRKNLPALISDYSLCNIFDAPCGDFNWMRHVVSNTEVTYLGGDIVSKLIADNNSNYATANIHFVVFDITKDKFPDSGLWLCRHCLFHLSFKHILKALECFLQSSIPYMLTTTHLDPGKFQNSDIASGDFRLIDLFSAPFNFPKEVLFRCDDYISPDPPMEICLWHRDQVAVAFNSLMLFLQKRSH